MLIPTPLPNVVTTMNARRIDYATATSIAFTEANDGTGQVMYLGSKDAEQIFEMRQSLSEADKLEMARHSGL